MSEGQRGLADRKSEKMTDHELRQLLQQDLNAGADALYQQYNRLDKIHEAMMVYHEGKPAGGGNPAGGAPLIF